MHPKSTQTISSAVLGTNSWSRTKLDSHVDPPVVGMNARIVKYMNREVTVSGFSDTLGSISKVPVVQAAVIYDCEHSGKSYDLYINNALFIKSMIYNLISPFLMRLNGLDVNECPKIMAKHPDESHYSIHFPDVELRIPLQLDKTTSYIQTRMPMDEDISNQMERLDLAPDAEEWNSHDNSYGDQERAMMDFHGNDVPKKKKADDFL